MTSGGWGRPEMAQDLEAVGVGQVEIQQDEVRVVLPRGVECGRAGVEGAHDGEAVKLLDELAMEARDAEVVLDDERADHAWASVLGAGRGRLVGAGKQHDGQVHLEERAAVWGVADADAAAAAPDEPPDQRQSDAARADAHGRFRRVARLEDQLAFALGDPDARIGDAQ
jgi:hypothetical protein